jgi:hypothetical protein
MNPIAQNGKEHSETNKSIDLLDPNLLKSARQIYYNYRYFHRQLKKKPVGFASDPNTYKGQLLFTKSPILLPCEYFVSVAQIESHNY